MYQVIARYVEIEGEPCVIEMINRLDDETLMDSEGRQNLVSKLNSYSEELYRDALTGYSTAATSKTRSGTPAFAAA